MKTVRELLQVKGHDVWSVTPDSSVYDALGMMADRGVGALLVLEGGKVVGIVSERDYAREVDLKGRSSRQPPVREIMTQKVVYIRPENTGEDCMAVMTHKRIRHLPVLAEDQLVGIISIGDVVKSIIAEQQFVIQQLEQYISGA